MEPLIGTFKNQYFRSISRYKENLTRDKPERQEKSKGHERIPLWLTALPTPANKPNTCQ